MLYVSPDGAVGGTYMLVRDEVWQRTGTDGQPHPHGRSVNILNPADVNQQFPSTAIHAGTAPNVIAVARHADKIQVFLNGEFLNQRPTSKDPWTKWAYSSQGSSRPNSVTSV